MQHVLSFTVCGLFHMDFILIRGVIVYNAHILSLFRKAFNEYKNQSFSQFVGAVMTYLVILIQMYWPRITYLLYLKNESFIFITWVGGAATNKVPTLLQDMFVVISKMN